MSKLASGSALTICALLTGQAAHAASNTPVGSYNLTCSNISVNVAADTLSATCVKLNNQSQPTTLPHLATCMNSITQNGDIAGEKQKPDRA